MKKKVTWKDILILQGIIIIYTLSSIFAKVASGQADLIGFFLFMGLEFFCLAVYALFWQQAIKKIELSVAYANRAMVLLWSMIWAVVIFHDKITVQNIVGIVLVIAGTFLINTEKEEESQA